MPTFLCRDDATDRHSCSILTCKYSNSHGVQDRSKDPISSPDHARTIASRFLGELGPRHLWHERERSGIARLYILNAGFFQQSEVLKHARTVDFG